MSIFHETGRTHPFGSPSKTSLDGPSVKLATRNQLVARLPLSSRGPELTPSAYRIISRPVDVGVASGVSARRPMSCIRARELGDVVVKVRAREPELRGRILRENMIVAVVELV